MMLLATRELWMSRSLATVTQSARHHFGNISERLYFLDPQSTHARSPRRSIQINCIVEVVYDSRAGSAERKSAER